MRKIQINLKWLNSYDIVETTYLQRKGEIYQIQHHREELGSSPTFEGNKESLEAIFAKAA